MNKIKLSKTISYILRHSPEDFNLQLSKDGSIKINELVDALNNKFNNITVEDIIDIVHKDDKGRFSLIENNNRIRANYGHSIKGIELNYKSVAPPDKLYHGTARKCEEAILNEGLKPMSRQYTHLSETVEEAVKVGGRHDKNPIIFIVEAKKAYLNGYEYYKTGRGIYLTEHVPPEFLKVR